MSSSAPPYPSMLFICGQCRKPIKLETDKPIQESTLLAFSSQLSPPALQSFKPFASPHEALAESFVVLKPPAVSLANATVNIPFGKNALTANVSEKDNTLNTNNDSATTMTNNTNTNTNTNTSANVTTTANTATSSSSSSTSSSSSSASPSTTSPSSSTVVTSPTTATSPSVSGFDRTIETLTRLLEVANSETEIDQPVCLHCFDQLTNMLKEKLNDANLEKETFQAALRQLQLQVQSSLNFQNQTSNKDKPYDTEEGGEEEEEEEENDEEETRALEALLQEEKLLQEKLQAVQKERNALNEECRSLESELSTVRALEEAYSVEYLDFIQAYQHLDSEQVLIKQQIKNTAEQLERLKYTNVMDDGFPISFDGHFGTISGFRLGKLPSQAIDWAEMSAGFGQVVLLMHTLSKQLGYKFTKYRLIPLGSFSRMAKVEDPGNTYELYGSQDLILGRLFWYRRFDQACSWLLHCLKELEDFVILHDIKFKPTYIIKNDQIGDLHFKLQFNDETKWTKALKYMLVNLKQLMIWTYNRKIKVSM